MSSRPLDVIVIGAGPYGLAAAAHLAWAGANARVLGAPMSFWERHMPRGMLLRSPWGASHIAEPRSALTLDEFERVRDGRIARPVPLADFVAYGHWFQQRTAPDLDRRHADRVDAVDGGYRVILEDGEPIESRRVVVAAGIADFAWRPPEFAGLPRELASHSSEEVDLGRFAGERVAVIGGGQSALESAALLRESGADVEVIMRAPRVRWVGRATRHGLIGRVLFHRTDVGPALVSHLVARPMLLRRLPPSVQRQVARRSLTAGAALWLRPRLVDVPITAGRRVSRVARLDGRLQLRPDDRSLREVDHVLLATGYRVDVRRYRFLPPALLARLRCVDGCPVLDEGLQSSAPGLHFLGAPAAQSFGPLLRFVSGTEFASRALVRSITRMPAGAIDHALAGRALDAASPTRAP